MGPGGGGEDMIIIDAQLDIQDRGLGGFFFFANSFWVCVCVKKSTGALEVIYY